MVAVRPERGRDMEKVEMKVKMPSDVQMANAERFRASVDPESEAGSVVHIYAQAVAALKERLDAKPADAPKTMPHLNDVLGWRERAVKAEAELEEYKKVADQERAKHIEDADTLRKEIESPMEGYSRLAWKDRALMAEQALCVLRLSQAAKESGATTAEMELALAKAGLLNKVEYLEQTVRGQLKAIDDLKTDRDMAVRTGSDLEGMLAKLKIDSDEKIEGLEDHVKELKEDGAQRPGDRCNGIKRFTFEDNGDKWEMCLPRKVGP